MKEPDQTPTLADLIRKLEKATEGSRELDAAIRCHLDGVILAGFEVIPKGNEYAGREVIHANVGTCWADEGAGLPDYTASLDAGAVAGAGGVGLPHSAKSERRMFRGIARARNAATITHRRLPNVSARHLHRRSQGSRIMTTLTLAERLRPIIEHFQCTGRRLWVDTLEELTRALSDAGAESARLLKINEGLVNDFNSLLIRESRQNDELLALRERAGRLETALRAMLLVERDNFPSVCAHRSAKVQEQYRAAIKQGREALAAEPTLSDG